MHPSGRQGWTALAVLLAGLTSLAPAARATASPSLQSAAIGAQPAVRLLEPADGAALSGGSTATLAWEPGPGLSLDGVVEWEAFLSLDGGDTWPIRITPHLDLALRRVSFPVPAVPSDDVRLLLRVGDERREVPVSVPGAFTIDATIAAQSSAILSAATLRYSAGESALPGGAGVVAWVEGTRRAGDLEPAVAVPLHSGWTGVHLVSLERFPVEAEPNPPIHERFPHPRASGITPVPEPSVQKPRPLPAPPGARAILLAIERLDE